VCVCDLNILNISASLPDKVRLEDIVSKRSFEEEVRRGVVSAESAKCLQLLDTVGQWLCRVQKSKPVPLPHNLKAADYFFQSMGLSFFFFTLSLSLYFSVRCVCESVCVCIIE